MDVLSLIFISVGMAMDAFAVSITNGMTAKNFTRRTAVLCALCYGGFQFAMPLIGWFAGSRAYELISSVDHWIAFALLAFIGGKMIFDAIKDMRSGEEKKGITLTVKTVILQGVATSIDALAIGISFAALGLGIAFDGSINIWIACLSIGVVTFVIPLIGGLLGKKIGPFLKNKAGILGGVILIATGIKILVEHLFF